MRVTVTRLKEGMVLSEDVHDRGGRVLMTQGTPVQEKHIRIFKTWGIPAVHVEEEAEAASGNGSETIDLELVNAAKVRALELFRHADLKHPVIEQLFSRCVSRIMQQKPAKGTDDKESR